MVKYLVIFSAILTVMGCQERYRYPCQDPANWEKEMCKKPLCDVTRTCPEHVFKGGRDPRLGPPQETTTPSTPAPTGASCK